MKLPPLFLYLALLAGGAISLDAAAAEPRQITCYPTYGYQERDYWLIPMRVWVHDRRSTLDEWVTTAIGRLGHWNGREQALFRARIQAFLADSESREGVTIRFDADPERRVYRIQDDHGRTPTSDLNGVIEGTIRMTAAAAQGLLKVQQARRGWLSYRALVAPVVGTGRVQLISPAGLSVISDIDDTLKITQVPAGRQVAVENTFFREFRAAPGMAALYRDLAARGAVFHYVSGGPWQLYGPLSDFLFSAAAGFPEGSFHMKDLWLSPLSLKTWVGLTRLVGDENATYRQKVVQIGTLLRRFPRRRFILVGDSGEKDPEVYRAVRQRFPGQVQEIRIRDVTNARVKNPDRLAGLTIIAAETVPAPRRADLGSAAEATATTWP